MELTAAVLREIGGDFGLETVNLGAPRPVRFWSRFTPSASGQFPVPLRGVLGHEGAGVVVGGRRPACRWYRTGTRWSSWP